jgi:urease accessory protein
MLAPNYAVPPIASGTGWQASLNLSFANRFNKTLLVQRKHSGPLTVQRPFYPEGDVCHVYLLHPPGGIVGGDELTINIDAAESSHALITTPAAGKFYRSDGLCAKQIIKLTIGKEALLEWLPQENIIYEGAHVKSTIQVDLACKGRFMGWEIISLGRPASGEKFDYGVVDLGWKIFNEGRPLLIERLQLDAKAFLARWGMQGFPASGTFFAKPVNRESLSAIQDLIGNAPNRGVTLIDDILVCRALDDRSDRLRTFFEAVWAIVRPELAQRTVCLPRIWST